MSFASVLFIPLALLAPASSALQPMESMDDVPGEALSELWPSPADQTWIESPVPRLQPVVAEPDDAWQVRIERRMTIRISPRIPQVMPPDMRVALPEGRGPDVRRYEERDMGDCVPADAIAGVQPERGNRLLLFMRGRRIVTAELERTCRAMDFYSGFYIARSKDGKVCVNRDKLQSRSGMKCGLTRMHELIPMRD